MLSRLLPVAAMLAAFVLNLWTAPPSTSAKDAKAYDPPVARRKPLVAWSQPAAAMP